MSTNEKSAEQLAEEMVRWVGGRARIPARHEFIRILKEHARAQRRICADAVTKEGDVWPAEPRDPFEIASAAALNARAPGEEG